MTTQTVSIVGTGTIGLGWAVSFCRAGWDVRLFDTQQQSAEAAAQSSMTICENLNIPAENWGAVSSFSNLDDALRDVAIVVEAVPERLALKQQVLENIENALQPQGLILSSTSAIPATDLAAQMQNPDRFLVAHPFNPSYLLPLVELVPGERTSPEAVNTAAEVLESVGQQVVRIRREIEGFVANRLQAAVVNEAVNLVAEDVASPEDVDKCLKDCLGLRWAFYGPFETMDLNAPSGFGEYAEKFGDSYVALGSKLMVANQWKPEALAEISSYLDGIDANFDDKRAHRDTLVSALLDLKRRYREG